MAATAPIRRLLGAARQKAHSEAAPGRWVFPAGQRQAEGRVAGIHVQETVHA
jgi:hypothetical protein